MTPLKKMSSTPRTPIPMSGVEYTCVEIKDTEMTDANPFYYKSNEKYKPKRFELSHDLVVRNLMKTFKLVE